MDEKLSCWGHARRGYRARAVRIVEGTPFCLACFKGAEPVADEVPHAIGRQALNNGRRHGTVSGYNAGCRCVRCLEAKRSYMRAWIREHPHRRRRVER